MPPERPNRTRREPVCSPLPLSGKAKNIDRVEEDSVKLPPTPTDVSQIPTPRRKPRKSDPGYIPRPRNCFIIFRSHFYNTFKDRFATFAPEPGMSPNEIMSCYWFGLAAEQRNTYIEAAKKEKEMHKLLYPGYRFNPMHKINPQQSKKPKKQSRKQSRKHEASVASSSPDTELVYSLLASTHPRQDWSGASAGFEPPDCGMSLVTPTTGLHGQQSGTAFSSSSTSSPVPLPGSGLRNLHLLNPLRYSDSHGNMNWFAIDHEGFNDQLGSVPPQPFDVFSSSSSALSSSSMLSVPLPGLDFIDPQLLADLDRETRIGSPINVNESMALSPLTTSECGELMRPESHPSAWKEDGTLFGEDLSVAP